MAEALKVSQAAVYNWIRDNPELKEALEEQKESNIDWVESKMFQLINGITITEQNSFLIKQEVKIVETEKKIPPDKILIMFFLKTQAKHRGYIEKTELDISRIEKVEVVFEEMPIMKKVS